MAHAIEGLWVRSSDRATALAAEEALRLLASSAAPHVSRRESTTRRAREDALEGAYLAGSVFGDVGGGLHR